MATGNTTTLRNDPVPSSQILERIQQAAGAIRTMLLVRFLVNNLGTIISAGAT
jgi:hypothetical protein